MKQFAASMGRALLIVATVFAISVASGTLMMKVHPLMGLLAIPLTLAALLLLERK